MPWLLTLSADQIDWPPWTREQFMMPLPRKWELSFFSPRGGVAVLSHPEGHDDPHLHLLAVHPHQRGYGLGSAMMREILKRTSGRLTLKVPCEASGSIRFYERHGFTLTARPADKRWWPMSRAGVAQG